MAKRDAGFFKYGSKPHRELLFAVIATPQETLVAFAGLGVFHHVHVRRLAMGANRLAIPETLFQKFNCRLFIAAGQRHFFNCVVLFQFRLGLVKFHASTLYFTQLNVNYNFIIFL